MVSIVRTNIRIEPNARRVLIRPFMMGEYYRHRISNTLEHLLNMSPAERQEKYRQIKDSFDVRHISLDDIFLKHFDQIKQYITSSTELTLEDKALIGAYFTSEYSLESAGLFNPSIIPHPIQDAPHSGYKFIMSLRSIGEGHVSSISFREGIINQDLSLSLTEPVSYVVAPVPNVQYEQRAHVFKKMLQTEGFGGEYIDRVLSGLPERFTIDQLKESMHDVEITHARLAEENRNNKEQILWLACGNYEITFEHETPLSSRIIFPSSFQDNNGIEDARFVRFTEQERTVYYATYVAFDGRVTVPKLIETEDFVTFRIHVLNGNAVKNKGLGLFPKKINGQYVMLSREDGENVYIVYSDDLHVWNDAQLLLQPQFDWEYVQIGNCGSPIETEKGWLVLTHGVGAMREYCIGAVLLDSEDPSRVIGRLKEPLLRPDHNEREGYVPNVVYSCGGLIHKDKLILPYAMSDYASRVAIVDVEELLGELTKN